MPSASRKRKASVDIDELYRSNNAPKKDSKLPKSESMDEQKEKIVVRNLAMHPMAASSSNKDLGIREKAIKEEEEQPLAMKITPILPNVLHPKPGSHCPTWLGTHKHLQAAIASIDDRLLFLRICEELEAKGIRYEQVCVEPLVGGHMLKLIDPSAVVAKHGIEYGDFFKNLLHCNIRLNLPDVSSQLECTFTNPPLVQDFERSEEEVETDRQKPHTWVLPIGNQAQRSRSDFSPSQSQLIAHQIEDRMLTYCHIYLPVRKFAQAYRQYFHNFCSVRTFTYHKLVLAYGDNRDLLVVLSWRWNWHSKSGKYSLCFGQSPVPNNKDGVPKRHWNPHVLVSQLLVERFNQDQDLTWLVNYLVNTHRALGIIHGFVRTQMHSNKIAAQILGTEAAFPAELMSYLVPLDEQIIRLTSGPQMAMEFMLLQDNQVAVRDCSIFAGGGGGGTIECGATLADFWRIFQQKSTESEEEEKEQQIHNQIEQQNDGVMIEEEGNGGDGGMNQNIVGEGENLEED